ncbi:Rod binding protein [uncultured Helicobacter sp.]|uniref:Rod binding protein n=1 Tax=uncultured Helicobacter sp. TaxID=175537 RepID=UPI0026335473|nr:Rod binding protein [uncultured Helicobacter sp.]
MKMDTSLAIQSYQNTKTPKIQNTNDDAKLKEQTDAFEALLLKTMLATAIKNEDPLYPKQAGSDVYHSMYLDTLSESLSGSFGYSELLLGYLKEQQAGKR